MKTAAMQSIARGLALVALLLGSQLAPANAADSATYFGGGQGRVVQLGVGKSYVVDLPANAAEVLVADPKIANAVVRSARKAYVIGIALGETDIIFFDAQGNQIESLAVSVARDMSPIRNNIQSSVPNSKVVASAVGDSVMLTGSVRSPAEAQTAVDVAANLVGGPDKVVNALAIQDRDQVMLKVQIVEMQRNIAKQFGIKLDLLNTGQTLTGFGSTPKYGLGSADPGAALLAQKGLPITQPARNADANGLGILHQWSTGAFMANIEALEANNMVRTLAEPNLTAISGERAEFLAGGEFPIRTVTDDGVRIEYKKYGVGLSFTPVVLANGRISLQLQTEVSERAEAEAITVRRALTVVELPSGGSLALAGLLREDSRQAVSGLTGLLNLPVLGALFRSRDFQRGQTELVVIVTPYLVKPNARDKLAKPDDGFTVASDAEGILLGQFNKIYAPGLKANPGDYRGPIGHTVE
jgi:pilus assembly protein CpaC